jgi:hypothetical protein
LYSFYYAKKEKSENMYIGSEILNNKFKKAENMFPKADNSRIVLKMQNLFSYPWYINDHI